MPEGTSSKTRQTAVWLNGCSFSRECGVIAHWPNQCDIATMARGLERIVRAAAIAIAAIAIVAAAPPQRIVAVGDLHGDYAA